MQEDFRIADECYSRQFGGRVGMGKTAAEGATVANLDMGYMGGSGVQQRVCRCNFRIGFELPCPRHRADMQTAGVVNANTP